MKVIKIKPENTNKNKVIYIDSMESFSQVKRYGLNFPIYTDDPVLAYSLREYGIINIDKLVTKKENFILGNLSLELADKIDRYIFSKNKIKKIKFINEVTLGRPLGVFLSSLLYRTLVFSRFIDKYKIQNIDIYINEDWNANSGSIMEISRFSNIFSELCRIKFFKNSIKFNIMHCPLDKKEERVDSSINNIFIKALIFPFFVNLRELFHKIGFLNLVPFNKSVLIIGEPDGIIREALPKLNFLGYKEKVFPKVLKGVTSEFSKLKSKTNEPLINNKDIKTNSFLNSSKLIDFFSNQQINYLSKIIDQTLYFHISKLPIWVDACSKYVSKIIKNDRSKNNKIILATALSNPISKIVHNIFNFYNYDIVLFEHGVTKGISALSSRRLHISEIFNTDHFVGYSNGSVSTLKALTNDNKVKSFITAAPIHNKKILFSNLQRLIWRKKLDIYNNEKVIIHVSPLPYSGNRRLGFGSPTETEVFEIEKNFITIYNQINKKVYYKKYPAYRFPFNFSLENIFSDYKNINFLGDLDYRYIRSAFDIIVTGSPSSTFSWCLSANKPLIFFDSNIINPLISDKVRRKIKNSVFYLNLEDNNWKIKLHDILNRPYERLMNEWHQMHDERKKFIKEYIFCDTKNPGFKVANYINNLIIK